MTRGGGGGGGGGGGVSVFFNVTVHAVPKIDTVGLEVTQSFVLSLGWRDPRVRFANLNSDISLNVFGIEHLTWLWAPRLSFSNALGNFQTTVDELSYGVLVAEGERDRRRAWRRPKKVEKKMWQMQNWSHT